MSGDIVELQRAFLRVCFGPEPAAADLALLGGDRARWMVYRRIVRLRLRESVADGVPRTRAALGGAFQRWLDAYFTEAPPRTRYIRHITQEWVAFVEPRWRGDPAADVPPHLADLARYEAAVLWVLYAEAEVDPESVVEFDMDLPVAFTPALRPLRVEWDVHRAPAAGAHARGAFDLLLYRDPTRHTVETLELSPIAAEIVEAMAGGDRTAAECVRDVLARHNAAAGQAFIESLANLLADYLERGIILGSRAPGAASARPATGS